MAHGRPASAGGGRGKKTTSANGSSDHGRPQQQQPPPPTAASSKAPPQEKDERGRGSSSPREKQTSPSRFSGFFRLLFSPFVNLFWSIYNLLFHRRGTTPPKPPTNDVNMATVSDHRKLSEYEASASKENVDPRLVTKAVADLTLRDAAAPVFPTLKAVVPPMPIPQPMVKTKYHEEDPAVQAEKEMHQGFINEALDMARLALRTNETPVGCVLVYRGRVIAKGMNATNITRNGTRHAEYMALSSLFAYAPGTPSKSCKHDIDDQGAWDEVDPSNGYLYPYGQKLHPSPRVNPSIVRESTLYVTVEPCVMCASLLRQLGVKKVYFGAVNDKFGGTGGVFHIHVNSSPAKDAPATPTRRVMGGRIIRVSRDGTRTPMDAEDDISRPGSSSGAPSQPLLATQASSSLSSVNISTIATTAPSPTPPMILYKMGKLAQAEAANQVQWMINPEPVMEPPMGPSRRKDGDGGNVETGFDAEGGWGRDEAVTLLRQFYVQENGRAPVPRKKEGRAARLAAMMEKEGMSPSIDLCVGTNMPASAPATVAGTPAALDDGEETDDPVMMTDNDRGMLVDVPTPMSEVA